MDWVHILAIAGIVSMILEIFIPLHFGFIGIGVGFLSAALMTYFGVSPWIQVPVATVIGLATIYILRKLIKPEEGVDFTPETIVGKTGFVKKVLNGKVLVFVDGEEWLAYNGSQLLRPGDKVKVVGIEGVHLKIQKL
ncbi:MAG: NfeD family protein [Chlorobi bacterium]|nr:NfeD family protein [Chlorobiota bacterium]